VNIKISEIILNPIALDINPKKISKMQFFEHFKIMPTISPIKNSASDSQSFYLGLRSKYPISKNVIYAVKKVIKILKKSIFSQLFYI